MTKQRTFNGRISWADHTAALIEHYSRGTVTNAEFAKSIGTTVKAVEARAHELKLTRQIKPKPYAVPEHPRMRAGISHPEPWRTVHLMGG